MLKKNIILIIYFILLPNILNCTINSQKSINIIDLPNIQIAKLPINIQKVIQSLTINNPEVHKELERTTITGTSIINNINIPTEVIINNDQKNQVTLIHFSLLEKWNMAKIIPELEIFSILPLNNLQLIIVNKDFYDKEKDVTYKAGSNIIGKLNLTGPMAPIAYLTNYRINETIVHGTFNKNSIYPEFTAKIPVTIKFGENISTIAPILQLTSHDANNNFSLLSCSLNNKILINIPGNEKPLKLNSKLNLTSTTINVFGSMNGKYNNAFGIQGLSVYDWKLDGSINIDMLTSLDKYIPISNMCLQCNIKLNDTTIGIKSKIDSSQNQEKNNMFFEGKIENTLSLKNYAEFVDQIIKNKKQPYQKKQISLMNKIKNYLPNIKLHQAHIIFSPTNTKFENKWTTKGLFIKGKANIFDSETDIMIDINDKGFNVYGYLQELDLGIITISGPGPDHILGNKDDGLIIDGKLTLDQQEFYMGAHIKLDIFGGIESDTIINFSEQGISCNINRSLFGLFNSELDISAKLNEVGTPNNFYIKGKFKQSALTTLQDLLQKSYKKLALKKQSRISLTEFGSQVSDTFWYLLSNAIGNTFNIQEVTFEGKLEKLINSTELPSVSIKGIIFGQKIELNNMTLDLYDPVASAETLILAIAELF